MNKFYAAFALFSLAITSPAIAKSEKTSFTRDGVSYTYSQSKVGNSTVVRGVSTPGSSFYLVIRGNRVTGTADGVPVSFQLSDVKGSEESVAVASR